MDRAMSDITMAVDAIEHFTAVAHMGVDAAHNLLMTGDAVALEHGRILGADHDGFMEILQRETFGMPVAVFRFGDVLADQIVRRVAVVTRCDGVVRRFQPAVELLPHDVTVYAGARITRKIRETFCVVEGVRAKPAEKSHGRGERQQENDTSASGGQFHVRGDEAALLISSFYEFARGSP